MKNRYVNEPIKGIGCKKFFFVVLVLFLAGVCRAQERKYSTFYYQRATLFEELPVTSHDIIFLGNSITNGAEWSELFHNKHVKNRGISGDICMGVYDRLDAILKGKPAKIFLLIGINDVSRGTVADTIVARIGLIVQKIKADSPKTKLYLQSVLPVTDHYGMFKGHTSRWQVVPEINRGLVRLAEKEGVTYIDLYAHFVDGQTGKMDTAYTNDGLHLLGKGYRKWVEIVKPYIGKK
ncbi:SGNH/GDSL hydrolase family protein [Bacteroides sp. AN502(2024)]|uniref:SGNH/GDSL hydrolase family protein n=1 Tax=Bacteroides sp. AN502(2024) TaxID=3160599 RepID=UPI0035113C53